MFVVGPLAIPQSPGTEEKKKGMNIVREEPPLLPAGRWDHTIGTSTEKPFELKLYNDVTK